MRTSIQELKELPFKNYLRFSIGVSFFVVLLVLALSHLLPPEVPLFYGLPIGNAQLVKTVGLVIPPVVSIVTTVLNVFIGISIKNLFIRKALFLASFFISILSAITVMRIILLVGYF